MGACEMKNCCSKSVFFSKLAMALVLVTGPLGCLRSSDPSKAALEKADQLRIAAENQAKSLREMAVLKETETKQALEKAATELKQMADRTAKSISTASERAVETKKDAMVMLSEAIQNCPYIGLKGKRNIVTANSQNYMHYARMKGKFSCFQSISEAKESGFLPMAMKAKRGAQ
jgi:hypothetical protein